MTGKDQRAKPKVLIPYLEVWDIADHSNEWIELSKEVDFVKYKVGDVGVFEEFLKSSDVDCLWITDDFVENFGGPSEFWDFFPPTLRAMVVPWVGCEFVDGTRLREEKDITLCNIGPAASDSVAETALFLVLSCFRLTSFWEHCFRFAAAGNVGDTRKYIGGKKNKSVCVRLTDSNEYHSYSFPETVSSVERLGLNLSENYTIGGKPIDSPTGKNALILGFGSIGQKIGQKLGLAFNMNIYYYKRSGPISAAKLGYRAMFCEDLTAKETWQNADVIVISLPGTTSTEDIINETTLAMCKTGVRIVNVGRGSCIDEGALIKALDSGQVSSCGLDVFKDESIGVRKELLSRWDVTLLPHIGSANSGMMIQQTLITLQNIRSLLIDGEGGIHPVN